MENKEIKFEKYNLTLLGWYYLILLIIEIFMFVKSFIFMPNNKNIYMILLIIIQILVTYFSFKKINSKNIGKILLLGVIVSVLGTGNSILVLIILITNIIICYIKKVYKNKILIIVSVILILFNLLALFLNLNIEKNEYEIVSPNNEYIASVEELPTGAGSSFYFNVYLSKTKTSCIQVGIDSFYHRASGRAYIEWINDSEFSVYVIIGNYEGCYYPGYPYYRELVHTYNVNDYL